MPSYFLLDTTHPNYATTLASCDTVHTTNAPGHLLSVSLNKDGSLALVKVSGVDKSWLSGPEVIEKENKTEHYLFVEMVQGDRLVVGTVWSTIDGGNAEAIHDDILDGGGA